MIEASWIVGIAVLGRAGMLGLPLIPVMLGQSLRVWPRPHILPPQGRTPVLLEPVDEVESEGAGVMSGAAGVPWSLSYPRRAPLCTLGHTRDILKLQHKMLLVF